MTAAGSPTRAQGAGPAPQVGRASGSVRPGHLPALDTLRAVGALAVLTTHVAFLSGSYTRHGVIGPLLARLDVGVALFFVLSGFLLSRPWLRAAADAAERPAARHYLWHRFLRIAPLYVLTVVVALASISANRDRSPSGWVSSLLMLDTFTDPTLPDGLGHMWSLAVEVSFYLVLPVLMVALVGARGRGPSPTRVLGGLLVLVAITVWWTTDGSGRAASMVGGAPGQWLPGYLSWFAAGILLAAVSTWSEDGEMPSLVRPLTTLAHHPGCCWAIAGGLLVIAASPVAGPTSLAAATESAVLTKNLLYTVIGFVVVLTGVFSRGSTYDSILGSPPGRHVGYISFGVFCLHMPLLYLWMDVAGWQTFAAPFIPLFFLALTSSLVVAEVTYRLVERPAMRLRGVGPGRPPDGASERRTHRGHRGRRGHTDVEADTSSAETGTSTTSDVHPS